MSNPRDIYTYVNPFDAWVDPSLPTYGSSDFTQSGGALHFTGHAATLDSNWLFVFPIPNRGTRWEFTFPYEGPSVKVVFQNYRQLIACTLSATDVQCHAAWQETVGGSWGSNTQSPVPGNWRYLRIIRNNAAAGGYPNDGLECAASADGTTWRMLNTTGVMEPPDEGDAMNDMWSYFRLSVEFNGSVDLLDIRGVEAAEEEEPPAEEEPEDVPADTDIYLLNDPFDGTVIAAGWAAQGRPGYSQSGGALHFRGHHDTLWHADTFGFPVAERGTRWQFVFPTEGGQDVTVSVRNNRQAIAFTLSHEGEETAVRCDASWTATPGGSWGINQQSPVVGAWRYVRIVRRSLGYLQCSASSDGATWQNLNTTGAMAPSDDLWSGFGLSVEFGGDVDLLDVRGVDLNAPPPPPPEEEGELQGLADSQTWDTVVPCPPSYRPPAVRGRALSAVPRLGRAAGYRVQITRRGGAVLELDVPPEAITGIAWERRVNEVAAHTVTLAKRGGGGLGAFERVECWTHEIAIWRVPDRGQPEVVALGPLVDYTETRTAITLGAADMGAWFSKRVIHAAFDFADGCTDLAEIARQLLHDALGPDDPGILQYARFWATGITAGRAGAAWRLSLDRELTDLAGQGLDWTFVGRRLYVSGDLAAQWPHVAHLSEDHFDVDVEVIGAGKEALTRKIIAGGGESLGLAGGVDAGLGLLEGVADAADILDNATARNAAVAGLAAAYPVPYYVRVPDGAALSADAPLLVGQLIPGIGVDVEIGGYVKSLIGVQRLTQVRGSWDPEGGERIAVSLSPWAGQPRTDDAGRVATAAELGTVPAASAPRETLQATGLPDEDEEILSTAGTGG